MRHHKSGRMIAACFYTYKHLPPSSQSPPSPRSPLSPQSPPSLHGHDRHCRHSRHRHNRYRPHKSLFRAAVGTGHMGTAGLGTSSGRAGGAGGRAGGAGGGRCRRRAVPHLPLPDPLPLPLLSFLPLPLPSFLPLPLPLSLPFKNGSMRGVPPKFFPFVPFLPPTMPCLANSAKCSWRRPPRLANLRKVYRKGEHVSDENDKNDLLKKIDDDDAMG